MRTKRRVDGSKFLLSGANQKLTRMRDVCAVSTFDPQPLLRQWLFYGREQFGEDSINKFVVVNKQSQTQNE
jgi:hypothetical protein